MHHEVMLKLNSNYSEDELITQYIEVTEKKFKLRHVDLETITIDDLYIYLEYLNEIWFNYNCID